jgi:hypothetical protein
MQIELTAAPRVDAAFGHTDTPKRLSPTRSYGARGSELFARTAEVPEYCPTRIQRALQRQVVGAIARGKHAQGAGRTWLAIIGEDPVAAVRAYRQAGRAAAITTSAHAGDTHANSLHQLDTSRADPGCNRGVRSGEAGSGAPPGDVQSAAMPAHVVWFHTRAGARGARAARLAADDAQARPASNRCADRCCAPRGGNAGPGAIAGHPR